MISRTAAAAASHPKYHKNTILQPNVFWSKFNIKDTQSSNFGRSVFVHHKFLLWILYLRGFAT